MRKLLCGKFYIWVDNSGTRILMTELKVKRWGNIWHCWHRRNTSPARDIVSNIQRWQVPYGRLGPMQQKSKFRGILALHALAKGRPYTGDSCRNWRLPALLVKYRPAMRGAGECAYYRKNPSRAADVIFGHCCASPSKRALASACFRK